MNEKVYCIKCIFYSNACIYPKNMQDSWLSRASMHKRRAQDINRNNNCKWFETKVGKYL